jgi:tetratricopeptide (TPR) repeat protein
MAMRFLRSLLLLAGLLALQPASSQVDVPGYPANVDAYDAREVAMLPRYCIYTQQFRERVPGGNDPAQITYWTSVMGEADVFHAMHHYCWGLMKLNRALYLARTEQSRTFYSSGAVGEFDYVLERSTEKFVLRPEILTKKGQALVLSGKGPQGVIELERAIALKPDYWPPYAQLSNFYKKSGDLKKARNYLEQALVHSPNVRSLQELLAELDKPSGAARANNRQ